MCSHRHLWLWCAWPTLNSSMTFVAMTNQQTVFPTVRILFSTFLECILLLADCSDAFPPTSTVSRAPLCLQLRTHVNMARRSGVSAAKDEKEHEKVDIGPDQGQQKQAMLLQSPGHFSLIKAMHLADLITLMNGFCGCRCSPLLHQHL